MAHVSLSRDDLLRLVFADDFFEQNQALAEHQDDVAVCRAAYQHSAAKSTCRCGGNPRVTFACMDSLLARLTAFKQENPDAVRAFIDYVGRKRNKTLGSITIYYRKTSDIPLQKFKFP